MQVLILKNFVDERHYTNGSVVEMPTGKDWVEAGIATPVKPEATDTPTPKAKATKKATKKGDK